MAWYRTGTVSVTNGSATVTGSSTAWIGTVKVGDGFIGPDERTYEVATLVSNTALTVVGGYLGATTSGGSYAIVPTQSRLADLSVQAATLINSFQSVSDVAADFTNTNIPAYDAQVASFIATGEASLRQAIGADSPMINMIADGGRFSDGAPEDLIAGSFVAPSFLVPFNGASPFVSAGKFIDNNTDFGGSGGALPPVVRALIDFTGKTQQRGQEFHVAQTTAGTGTSIQMGSTGHYLLTVNGNAALPYSATISFFLRAKSGSVAIEREHHRNGTSLPGSAILPGNGWYHIRQSFVSTNGFDNARPRIYATPGAEVQIALLAVMPGLLAHPEFDRAIPIPSTLWRF